MNTLQPLVVVKFGGSVLEDEEALEKAASIIHDASKRGLGIVVVVSAMKGVTSDLISLSKRVNPNISPSMLDDFLALGEKTSTRLFASALEANGLNSVVVDPDSPFWPIVTDDNHTDASPLLPETRMKSKQLILPLIQEGKIPVVCGFLGKTDAGRTTTLGRGGSDTTAVVLGNCLDAKEVVLIKDVAGVFSSDPDKVKNPRLIETLDSEEAELLAIGGAKFLHAKALHYQTAGTRIRVTSLDKLDSGTIISGEFLELQVQVFPERVSMITVVGLNAAEVEPIVRVSHAVKEAKGSLLALSLELHSVLFYVAGGQNVLDRIHEALVKENLGKAVSSFEGLSMISIKGSALETTPGLVQIVTQPLARERINLYGVVTISSSIRMFVPSDQAKRAVELINTALPGMTR
jgi:aspartate kinase